MMASMAPSRAQTPDLDELDLKILLELQEAGRLSNVTLSERVGLSPAPCMRRIRALERAGVIRKYVALVDPSAIGLGLTVFIQVSLNTHGPRELATFERALLDRPEVLECCLMTGDADYLLRVAVRDVAAYEQFLRDAFTGLEIIARVKSSFAIRQAKYSTALPLPGPPGSTRKATGRVPRRKGTR